MTWKFHPPGHNIDVDECCCLESDNCRPYFPCCFRQFSAGFGVLVADQDGLFPDDPDAGPLSLARIKRFTVKNLCNSQESADWSVVNDIDSATAGGEVQLEFAGRAFQGCSYGIDISLEDVFCPCSGVPSAPNFQWTATICNPQDVAIWVTIRQPELCFSFDGSTFCCLDQIGLQTIGPVLIAAGADFSFTVQYKHAYWKNCIDVCYKGGPPAILEGPQFLNDGLSTTCLRPISCVGEVNTLVFQGQEIDNCDNESCPVCGCRLDLDCELEECCGCGCDGIEPMNACAPPKELCAGCTADAGSFTICESFDQGLGASGVVLRCLNDDCKLTAEIQRVFNTNLWTFTRFGSPGATVTVTPAATEHCGDYDVEWDISGGNITITVNGTSNSLPLPGGYNPLTPSGSCYVLASSGSTFTLK